MTQEQTLKDNKLIDLFLDSYLVNRGWSEDALNYNSDWINLMMAVEKIEESKRYMVIICRNCCTIQDKNFNPGFTFRLYWNEAYADTKLEATCSAVAKFIEWQNQAEF